MCYYLQIRKCKNVSIITCTNIILLENFQIPFGIRGFLRSNSVFILHFSRQSLVAHQTQFLNRLFLICQFFIPLIAGFCPQVDIATFRNVKNVFNDFLNIFCRNTMFVLKLCNYAHKFNKWSSLAQSILFAKHFHLSFFNFRIFGQFKFDSQIHLNSQV